MVLTDVEDEEVITVITDAVVAETPVSGEPQIRKIHAVDITFLNAAGEEIEPLKPVRVEMTAETLEEDEKAEVVHVTDAGDASVFENVEVVSDQEEAVAIVTSDEFSVYALVYTVDLHYEVNGKLYEFSIPGGGFVSFYNLVEVLGIEVNDTDTEKDEIQELVDGVESIMFSNPELVSVCKVEEDTTVRSIKERFGLECEYSAELTEEQIEEINAQEVKGGDWALICLKAFDTEEELSVTMKNGDSWKVMVTDAQKKITDVASLDNGQYIIYRSDSSGAVNIFMKNDGSSTVLNPRNNPLTADSFSDYTWNVKKNSNGTYTISSTQNPSLYINLQGNNNEYTYAGSSSANLLLYNNDND